MFLYEYTRYIHGVLGIPFPHFSNKARWSFRYQGLLHVWSFYTRSLMCNGFQNTLPRSVTAVCGYWPMKQTKKFQARHIGGCSITLEAARHQPDTGADLATVLSYQSHSLIVVSTNALLQTGFLLKSKVYNSEKNTILSYWSFDLGKSIYARVGSGAPIPWAGGLGTRWDIPRPIVENLGTFQDFCEMIYIAAP